MSDLVKRYALPMLTTNQVRVLASIFYAEMFARDEEKFCDQARKNAETRVNFWLGEAHKAGELQPLLDAVITLFNAAGCGDPFCASQFIPQEYAHKKIDLKPESFL